MVIGILLKYTFSMQKGKEKHFLYLKEIYNVAQKRLSELNIGLIARHSRDTGKCRIIVALFAI